MCIRDSRKAATSAVSLLLRKSRQSYVPPYFLALIYASLGEDDDALQWLEEASTVRDSYFHYSRVEPYFNAQFRADERFKRIVSQANLTPNKMDSKKQGA